MPDADLVHRCQETALRAIEEEGADSDLRSIVTTWARLLLERTEQKAPPYDIDRVARQLKAEIKVAHLSTDARLIYRFHASTIFVSAACKPPTRRFSIAHECAHIVLRNVYERRIKDPELRDNVFLWGHSDVQERLCDAMAAEMLMPRNIILEDVRERTERGKELAELLASRYHVSLSAALRRLVDLDLPYLIVSWRYAARPGGVPKLRVAWSWKPASCALPFIPNHKPAPLDGLIHRVHTTKRAESGWDDLGFLRLGRRIYFVDALPTKLGVLALVDLERRCDEHS